MPLRNCSHWPLVMAITMPGGIPPSLSAVAISHMSPRRILALSLAFSLFLSRRSRLMTVDVGVLSRLTMLPACFSTAENCSSIVRRCSGGMKSMRAASAPDAKINHTRHYTDYSHRGGGKAQGPNGVEFLGGRVRFKPDYVLLSFSRNVWSPSHRFCDINVHKNLPWIQRYDCTQFCGYYLIWDTLSEFESLI